MEKNEIRIIKKYPNRRLYDTTISSYITLEDIRKLVVQQENFHIQDAKTGEDITRSILLQVILEQEQIDENPLFTSEVLTQLIRFYGNTLQGIISNYLERSLVLFAKQQDDFREKMYNPLSLMTEIAEQNINLWKDLQENFFRTTLIGSTHDMGKKEDNPINNSPNNS
jgi:polyhydroxyalkanoate synthesis repressor PhaR